MLLCSGKTAYDLLKARAETEGSAVKTAVIRLEVRKLHRCAGTVHRDWTRHLHGVFVDVE